MWFYCHTQDAESKSFIERNLDFFSRKIFESHEFGDLTLTLRLVSFLRSGVRCDCDVSSCKKPSSAQKQRKKTSSQYINKKNLKIFIIWSRRRKFDIFLALMSLPTRKVVALLCHPQKTEWRYCEDAVKVIQFLLYQRHAWIKLRLARLILILKIIHLANPIFFSPAWGLITYIQLVHLRQIYIVHN